MGLKVSTGRGTRLKHSTGYEWSDLEKAKKKYPRRIKYSTGESSPMLHATGTEMDTRALRDLRGESVDEEEEELAEEEPAQEVRLPDEVPAREVRLHSVPAKAGEDTKYLDLYTQSMRNKVLGQRDDTVVGRRGKRKEDGEEAEKEISKGEFKTVTFDY